MRTYAYVIGGAFWLAVAFVLALEPSQLPTPFHIAPLLGLAIAGEELVLRQRQRSGASVLSFSALAHVAAVLLVGPLAAALIAGLAVIIVDGLRPAGRRYALLNSAMLGGAIWVAGLVFQLCGGSRGTIVVSALPALGALIVARYVVTSLIFAGGTVLASGMGFIAVVKESVVEETSAALGEGSLGVLVAFGAAGGHWVLFPFLLPLLAALYGSKSTFQRLKVETAAALEAVADVVDERDPSTAEHTRRVADYVRGFADVIRLPQREAERLVSAAKLHDLGKIAVDVSTLAKRSRLTGAELETIRRHPRLSAHLLSPFHFAQEMALFVELHHERYDGCGYYSVEQADVPIEAHVLIVADSFDAMTSERPYRPALSREEAVEELLDKAGTQFHPLVARAFAAMVREEALDDALSRTELASLRGAFSRVSTLSLPNLRPYMHSRTAGIAFAVLALVLVALPHPFNLIAAILGAGGLVAFLVWIAEVVGAGRRCSRARELLDAGHAPAAVLAAVGLPASIVWLLRDPEDGAYRAVATGAPTVCERDYEEACEWALRREGAIERPLASGGHLSLAGGGEGGARLALFFESEPAEFDAALLELIRGRVAYESAVPGFQLRLIASDERRGTTSERALLLIELGAFEPLRVAAGQLIAERVIANAEERLRALLRSDDTLVSLGEDRFGGSVFVPNGPALDSLTARIRAELEAVAVPQRAPRVRPRIKAALFAEALADRELVLVSEALEGTAASAAR